LAFTVRRRCVSSRYKDQIDPGRFELYSEYPIQVAAVPASLKAA